MSNKHVADAIKDLLGGDDRLTKCDVCKDEPMVGVAAVPGVPMSVAYGRNCLDANAHPMWVLVANTALAGGYEHTAEWWQQMVDDSLARLGKTREEFDVMVADDITAMDEAMAEEAAREPSDEPPNNMEPF